jgi:preprotein translocase subunit SecE
MKKNNQKPKSKKSPKKSVKGATTVASTSEGSVKAGQDVKPGKVIQKRAKAAKSGEGGVSNVFKTVGLFLRQAKVELKKVKWPTRKELIASTVVVIVLTILISFYLGLVDLGLIKIIKHVIG